MYTPLLTYDARFEFVVWATGHWRIGECVILFRFSLHVVGFVLGEYAIVLQSKTCVANPMSILYISPMSNDYTLLILRTATKNHRKLWVMRIT